MSGIALPIDAVSGAPAFPAAQNRVADAALAAGRTDRALGAVSGFRPGGEPAVSITSARVWTATPSNGIIDPGTAPTVGPYRFAFIANETGTLAAADATFDRIDRLDIQVPDDPAGASPLAAVYVVTTGVAQSSPQVPAAPPRSFPVGTFSVPHTGNPSFSATYPRTAAAGGVIPVRAGVRPVSPYVGMYIDDAALGLLRWNGTVWVSAGVAAYAAGQRPAAPVTGQYIDDATLGLLRWNGTAWTSATAPRAQYTQGAISSLPGGAFTKIANMVKDVDTIGLTAAASVFTFPAGSSGKYEFSGAVVVTETGTLIYASAVYINGVNAYAHQIGDSRGGGVLSIELPTKELAIAAGDQVYLAGFRGSATENTYSTAPYKSFLRIKRVD